MRAGHGSRRGRGRAPAACPGPKWCANTCGSPGRVAAASAPLVSLVDGLQQLGCNIDYAGNAGYPPLRIRPRQKQAQADGQAPVRVRGDVSSQFLTALLMAAPLAEHATTIEVEGELISKPYIAIPLAMMAQFGVQVQRDSATGWQSFTIAADAHYHSPGSLHVEN